MFFLLHEFWIIAFFAAPAVAVIYALRAWRRGHVAPAADLILTMLLGALLGTAGSTLYAVLVGGRVQAGQFMQSIYFGSAILIMLKLLDWCVRRALKRLKLNKEAIGSAVVRGLVLIGVGLPFVLAGAVTFRPKVMPRGDPLSLLNMNFTPVEFPSTDSVHLSGWWIPKIGRQPGDRTVILCHGLAANKSTQLSLIRRLVPAGYNALVFDLRAHGESGGQFTSMGDLERRDVLGAVHWLRKEHPEQSKEIYGIGVNIGAAALIGAATDPSEDGQAINAIAVYGAFDDLNLLAADFTGRTIVPPLAWSTRKLGLPMASLYSGAELSQFKPALLVPNLWPRPIMVIHGTRDRVVPFDDGQALFDAATLPKRFFWVTGKDLEQTLSDDGAAAAVREFFDSAEPMPVI